jgi:hypothetical protein
MASDWVGYALCVGRLPGPSLAFVDKGDPLS